MNLNYSRIGNLTSGQSAYIIRALRTSCSLELRDELPDGRLSHIVVKNNDKSVGFLGDDFLECCNARVYVRGVDLSEIYTSDLIDIYKDALRACPRG
jgi:hypothetical protein